MLKHKWLLPMLFAALLGGLAMASHASQTESVMLKEQTSLNVGTEKTWELELEPDAMYTLRVLSARVPLGQSYDITAELSHEDQPIFAMSDSFWHQVGTWREDGESGQWNEANSNSKFNFRVAKKAKHALTLSLDGAAPKLSETFAIRIMKSKPLPFGTTPLWVGFAVFLILGLYMRWKRSTYFAKSLSTYDVGTMIKIEDIEYLVDEISDFYYQQEYWSTELKLRGNDGSTRYLASGRFELEGEESTKTYYQTLFDVPLNESEERELEQQVGRRDITFHGKTYIFDDDNSGLSTQIIIKNGVPFKNRVETNLYYDPLVFPKKVGEIWIENSSTNHDENEWGIFVIMDWNKIKFIKSVKRAGPAFSPNDIMEQSASDFPPMHS